MSDERWEYELVYIKQLNIAFQNGWEPVPNVPKIIGHDLREPMEYLVLRRMAQ